MREPWSAAGTMRVLRERVTLDAALDALLADVPRTLVPAARSLYFGAVRGYYRHEAISAARAHRPAEIPRAARPLDPVGGAVRARGCAHTRLCRGRCGGEHGESYRGRGPRGSSMPCCGAICASASRWRPKSPAHRPRATPLRNGSRSACARIGRIAGRTSWPPAMSRRRCGYA